MPRLAAAWDHRWLSRGRRLTTRSGAPWPLGTSPAFWGRGAAQRPFPRRLRGKIGGPSGWGGAAIRIPLSWFWSGRWPWLVLQGLGVGEGWGAAFRDRPKLWDRGGFLRACGARSSRAGGSVPRHAWSLRHVGNPALRGRGAGESGPLTRCLCNFQRQLFAGGSAGADCAQLS